MKVEQLFDRSAQLIGLAWGIHQPFRQYVERMTDGVLQLQDEARLLDSGEIFFPLEAVDTQHQALRFGGSAVFQGHQGMMAVPVTQPWIVCAEATATLTIVDPFDTTGRMPLVNIIFGTNDSATTSLTESGTDLFMGNYQEQTRLDPVRLVWAEKDFS